MQRRRLEREGERPVPHYWDHVLWVLPHVSVFIADWVAGTLRDLGGHQGPAAS